MRTWQGGWQVGIIKGAYMAFLHVRARLLAHALEWRLARHALR